jgi:hypothetical protein
MLKQLKVWNKQKTTPWKRKLHFIPQKYNSLRTVPAYDRFINERFQRCLDLYLCPRARKMRVSTISRRHSSHSTIHVHMQYNIELFSTFMLLLLLLLALTTHLRVLAYNLKILHAYYQYQECCKTSKFFSL